MSVIGYAAQYTVVDVGALTFGHGINATRHVAGEDDSGSVPQAFLYTPGSGRSNFLASVSVTSVATAVNDGGQVVGFYQPNGTSINHAFLYSGGTAQDLTPGGAASSAGAINATGQITGTAIFPGFSGTHAFKYPALQDLGILGGTNSYGFGINASGQITGVSDIDSMHYHAFVYTTSMMDLGTLGGSNSIGSQINSSGWITGVSNLYGDATSNAFLYKPGTVGLLDLGTLGISSFGSAINSSGTVVGYYLTSSAQKAFIWTSSRHMVDLTSLIDPALGITLKSATGINDLGEIVANGTNGHTYLLIPVVTGSSPQTITFGPLSNKHPGDAPFTVSATASSGLAVNFASTTPSVCTVSGSTVTILISGGCSITATQDGNATFAPAPPVTQRFTVLFGDVDPAAYYFNAVNLLAQQSITAGCGSNNYCPTQNVTRAQMAIFMVRSVYGSDSFASSTTPYFGDVTAGTFGFKWIQKMKELGITAGCGSGNYCPNDSVTRDQMAIFMERVRLGLTLAGSPPTFTYPSTPYFTDVPNSDFGFPWVQRLKLDNITAGCTVSTYCPNSPVTRGDMAIFIMRGAFNQLLPAGTPILTQISPSVLTRGASAAFTIVGVNTNFVQGTTSLSPIAGVTIGTITVNSPTMLTVQLTAASNATPQPYSLLAITGNEQAVLPNGLVIQ